MDSFEHPHATGPALDVLTQPTQHDKLGTTVRLRTPVYLVLMTWALQVLVEPLERLQLGAFYASAIPVARGQI